MRARYKTAIENHSRASAQTDFILDYRLKIIYRGVFDGIRPLTRNRIVCASGLAELYPVPDILSGIFYFTVYPRLRLFKIIYINSIGGNYVQKGFN